MKMSDKIKSYKKLANFIKETESYNIIDKDDKENYIIKEMTNLLNINSKTIKKYYSMIHLPDSILKRLDALDTIHSDKISLEFAYQLSRTSITDEDDLEDIIKSFGDLSQLARVEIIKEIGRSKTISNCSAEIFIKKIKQGITIYNKTIEEKKQNKTKLKVENINLDIKQLNSIAENETTSETDKIYIKSQIETKKRELSKYGYLDKKNIVNNSSENNSSENNSSENIKCKQLYINTEIRNPVLQNEFRNNLIEKFNCCIITKLHYDLCDASHIIPFSESQNFDISNGILLNKILHKLFDNFHFSINPDTLRVVVNIKSIHYEYLKNIVDVETTININDIKLIENLKIHYEQFIIK